MGFLNTNAYILFCPSVREAAIIDPGGEPEKIAEKIHASNLKVKYIFNTHGHSDHTAANSILKDEFGGLIVVHKLDAFMLSNTEINKWYPEFKPSTPDITVEDGEVFELDTKFGVEKLKVVHTPGHTPGSMIIMMHKGVFTGDTIFKNGLGRVDLPFSSKEDMKNSIMKILSLIPDSHVIYPGHGEKALFSDVRETLKHLIHVI